MLDVVAHAHSSAFNNQQAWLVSLLMFGVGQRSSPDASSSA